MKPKIDFTALARSYITESQETSGVIRQHYEEQRRCTETRADGMPCQAWAVWDAPEQKCSSHLHRRRRKASEMTEEIRQQRRRRKGPVCICQAYQWPHRQGHGLCRWPDEPTEQHPTPAGKRAPGKIRRREIQRILRKAGFKM